MHYLLLLLSVSLPCYASHLPSGAPLSSKEWKQCENFIKNEAPLLFKEGLFFIPHNKKLPCSLERDLDTHALYINLEGKKGSFIGKGRNKVVTKSILYGNQPSIVARCYGNKTVFAEGTILKALKGNRGIVQFYSLIQRDSKNIDLFIEYCNLGELRELKLNELKLDSKGVLNIILDLFIGLKAVHDNGYLHRDIHPKNILLSKENGSIRALLADFGLSFGMNEHYDSRISVPDITCSPEVLLSEYRFIGRRKAESYSLATVIYRLITDDYPSWSNLIHQESRGSMSQEEKIKTYYLIERQYQKTLKEDLKNFSGLSREILQICFKMMHPNPDARAYLDFGIDEILKIYK